MSAESNKDLTLRYIDQVWNKRKPDLIEEFIAEDVAHHGGPPMPGLEGMKQAIAMNQKAFPDVKVTVEDVLVEGDKVVHRWTFSGTHQAEYLGIPATGKQIVGNGMTIFRLAGGKIVEIWVQGDNMGMMQQLGVIPTPEA